MNSSESDLWVDIGFNRNPYDYKPLRVDPCDRTILVDRSEEERQFKLQVAGSNGGIVVVQGSIGVGKTSFVNAMQYDKWKNEDKRKYMPSFETIELKEGIETSDLMLSVLSNCIFSLEKMHGASASESDPDLRSGKELIANTVRSGIGFNISIMGAGGGIERGFAPVSAMTTALPTIMYTMDRWFDKAAQKFGYHAFMVPINNLDILPEEFILSFLSSARDILLTRHRVWWILVAGSGFFRLLETKARRVSELITGLPISLNPLSLEELHEAIDIRAQSFRKNDSAELPVPAEAVDILYEVSNGEIRYVFKRLSDLVYSFRLAFPSEKQIPIGVAKKTLQLLASQKMAELNLTENERALLRKMSSKKKFRIKEFSEFGFSRAQRFDRPVRKFINLGLLSRSQKTAKEVWYSTTGDVNLALM